LSIDAQAKPIKDFELVEAVGEAPQQYPYNEDEVW